MKVDEEWRAVVRSACCKRPAAELACSVRWVGAFRGVFCYILPSMATLTYRTAGESHGRALTTLIEGMPAGVPVDKAFIDAGLRRRQGGYGRGGRQKIETDAVEILAGV